MALIIQEHVTVQVLFGSRWVDQAYTRGKILVAAPMQMNQAQTVDKPTPV